MKSVSTRKKYDYSESLALLDRNEEFLAEKRINSVTIPLIILFLIFSVYITIVTRSGFNNPNGISNYAGLFLFLSYHLIIRIFLKKNISYWFFKYLTMFFSVTVITIIVFGYHYGVDYVHTTRSVTLTAYFIIIILSGQYQNPKVCLYTSAMVSIEYFILFLLAGRSGLIISAQTETFRENILTYDILMVYLFFFTAAGFVMFLNTRRHRILIRELKESTIELDIVQEEAKLDGLTQILNRKSFDELIRHEIARSKKEKQSMALLLLDIDHFKRINDNFGHLIGDRVLIDIVKIIEKCISSSTDELGRYGGEEFMVLLPSHSRESAILIAEKIRKSISEYDITVNGEDLILTISIGVFAAVPDKKTTIYDFLRNADEALFRAKKNGRNRVEA